VLVIPKMPSVKISTKHQIAVPSEASEKPGLKAGDRPDVEIECDVIHLRRHVPAQPPTARLGWRSCESIEDNA